MSKKISIYSATYGKRLDEADRNDANMSIAQDAFENPDNDGDDAEPDGFAIADAIDYLGEYFMEDAARLGYDNINDLAVEQYGIDSSLPEPGQTLIEEMLPEYFAGNLS
jgi:hypothetical protein